MVHLVLIFQGPIIALFELVLSHVLGLSIWALTETLRDIWESITFFALLTRIRYPGSKYFQDFTVNLLCYKMKSFFLPQKSGESSPIYSQVLSSSQDCELITQTLSTYEWVTISGLMIVKRWMLWKQIPLPMCFISSSFIVVTSREICESANGKSGEEIKYVHIRKVRRQIEAGLAVPLYPSCLFVWLL